MGMGRDITVSNFVKTDQHDRSHAKQYEVETVSLSDLLLEHGAPSIIDYLSIDTEGSELKILEALDFSKWSFLVITVDHNFTKSRKSLYSLLTSKGYVQVLHDNTGSDDW